MSKTVEIIFERNYHISWEDRYLFERIHVKKILDETDDIQDAIDEGRMEVFLNHKRNNPEMFKDNIRTPYVPISPKKEETKVGFTVQDINTCKDFKTLKIYRSIIDRNPSPELETAYNNKLKELT